ncbi:MAG: ankyrin repeat domain-containing protein [Bacteroidales bacterium]
MRLKFLNFIILFLIPTIFTGGCKGRTGGEDQDNNIPVSAANRERTDSVTGTDEYIIGSDESDEQLLREAAMEGNAVRVEQLVSGNTDVNSSLPDGRTALMLAAYNGHTAVMDLLMNAGAEVEMKDEHDRTALMYASTGHFPNAVKLLLENGADPNVIDKEEKFSPLMFAAAEGHFEVVKILLENDADATLKDKDGDTAESFARINGHERVAELLSRYK